MMKLNVKNKIKMILEIFDRGISRAMKFTKMFENFILSFTPFLFKILGWLLMLGALAYVKQSITSMPVSVIYFIAFHSFYLFLWISLYKLFETRKKSVILPVISIVIFTINYYFLIYKGLLSALLNDLIENLSIK